MSMPTVCVYCGEEANETPLSMAGTMHKYGPRDHDFTPKVYTMRELAEAEVKAGRLGTFDYAVPQQWFDDVHRVTGFWPRGVVWSYPPESIWGVPYALTEEAQRIIDLYDERKTPLIY